jgi:putative transposase
MPYARKDTLIWQKGLYYHIYNRGARQLTIFRETTNYLFAISKIKEYSQAKRISVIAYCLMPNHYHFLLRQDGSEPAGDCHNSYSTVIRKHTTKSTRVAVHFSRDGFGRK